MLLYVSRNKTFEQKGTRILPSQERLGFEMIINRHTRAHCRHALPALLTNASYAEQVAWYRPTFLLKPTLTQTTTKSMLKPIT